MALIRMRESISLPNSTYESKILTNDSPEMKAFKENKIFKTFNESTKKSTLRENEYNQLKSLAHLFEDNSSSKQVFLSALDKIKETSSTQDMKIWKLPVARFGNVNKNRRIYTKRLWENVIDKQTNVWKGGLGLCDHPEADDDPGEVKYAGIVWLDCIIDEINNLIWGIGIFVGAYGRLFQEIIEAGGRLGFSSSGFGETMRDGITVDPDSYQIERVADIVINPSQNVYGDLTEMDPSKRALNVEFNKAKMPVSAGFDTNTEFVSKSKIKEKTMAVINAVETDKKKIQEGTTPAAGVTSAPASTAAPAANAQATPAAKKPGSTDQPPSQTPSTTPAAGTSNSVPVKEDAGTTNGLLLTKYAEEFLAKTINEIESPTLRLSELKELQENLMNVVVTNELREKVAKRIEEEEKGLQKLIEDAAKLKNELASDDLDQFREDIKKFAEEASLLKEEHTDYVKLSEGLVERNKQLNKEIIGLKVRLKMKEKVDAKAQQKLSESLVGTNVQVDALLAEMREDKKNVRILKERVAFKIKKERESREEIASIESINRKLSESNKRLEKQYSFTSAKLKEASEALASRESQVTRLQEQTKTLKRRAEEAENEYQKYKEQIEYDSIPTNHLEKPASHRISKFVNFRENKGETVENYWSSLVERYGESVLPFEDLIRKAKTYREASTSFLRHRDEIDSSFRDAHDAVLPPQITSRKVREGLLKSAGYNRDTEEESTDVDALNKAFLENAKKFGFN